MTIILEDGDNLIILEIKSFKIIESLNDDTAVIRFKIKKNSANIGRVEFKGTKDNIKFLVKDLKYNWTDSSLVMKLPVDKNATFSIHDREYGVEVYKKLECLVASYSYDKFIRELSVMEIEDKQFNADYNIDEIVSTNLNLEDMFRTLDVLNKKDEKATGVKKKEVKQVNKKRERHGSNADVSEVRLKSFGFEDVQIDCCVIDKKD